jgi:hypothetical protein
MQLPESETQRSLTSSVSPLPVRPQLGCYLGQHL